jgi:hypothetical protein
MNIFKSILLLAVLVVAGSAFKCSKPAGGPTFTGAMSDKVQAVTPKGASVHSSKAIPAEALTAVDQGLDKLFFIAANPPNNYTGFNLHSAYKIWLLTRDPRCVNPGFTEIVYSDPWPNGYDETYSDSPANHWDKDPRPGSTLLCVAGFMARSGATADTFGSPGMGVVDDLAQLPTIVRFEGEHNVLLEVDLQRFAATQYHYGANGGHPIMPDASGQFAAETLRYSVKPFDYILPQAIESDGRQLVLPKGTKIHALLVQ